MSIVKINAEGTPFQSLEIQGKWESLEFSAKDDIGDIQIDGNNDNQIPFTLHLNPLQIKMLITHLQNQLL
jgi:hypothetical protein